MIKLFQKTVKKKFGSMAWFAELAKIEYYELQKLIAAAKKLMTLERKKRFKELIELAKATPADQATAKDLTPDIREAIKKAIEEHGGVTAFVERYPGYSSFSLWQIMNGSRKSISKTVKNLMTLLNIPHND